jgi:hypothetical protein
MQLFVRPRIECRFFYTDTITANLSLIKIRARNTHWQHWISRLTMRSNKALFESVLVPPMRFFPFFVYKALFNSFFFYMTSFSYSTTSPSAPLSSCSSWLLLHPNLENSTSSSSSIPLSALQRDTAQMSNNDTARASVIGPPISSQSSKMRSVSNTESSFSNLPS